VTSTQIIYHACRLLGYTRQGMTLPADVLADGLAALNDIVSQWRTQSLLVFAITELNFTLVINQQTFTIGPTGANFTAARPEYIKDANLVLNNVTPVVTWPLEILRDSGEWAAITVQNLQNAIPLKLYYRPTVPNGTIQLWPGSSVAYGLQLFVWGQLASFADLTTSYDLPPGYESALKFSLASDIAPMLPPKMGPRNQNSWPIIEAKARRYVANLKSINATPRRLGTDAPAMPGQGNGGYFNWLTGNLTTRGMS